MTPEEHQAEHARLHRAIDELLACYLFENSLPGKRTSVRDEILDLLKWSHDKSLLPSPVPEDAALHCIPLSRNCLVAQNDDPELLEWLVNAKQSGGHFISNLAHAGLVADLDNYPMIRVLLMAMRKKYPAYEPSDQVKQEIRDRVKP